MMLFVSSSGPDAVRVIGRLESDGMIGDMMQEIKPGGTIFNLSFDDLRKYEPGDVINTDETGAVW